MKKIMGYLTDWCRERRIRHMTDCAVACMIKGDLDHARSLDQTRRALINARSPEQVARMEARMGLR